LGRVILILLASMCLLLSGCAAIAPLSSLVSAPTGPPPVQVNERTSVELASDNFILVRTNVVGRSRGFALLGLLTIYPATLTKAMNRLYGSAGMQPGRSQSVAHLVIEKTSSYYLLFGIPEVDVRADVVEFAPHQPQTPFPASTQAVAGQPERSP
jgi:hypothetical protein